MEEYHILPEWEKPLKAEGLDSLQALLDYSGGTCLSIHRRGATFRHVLAAGTVVFIKRDHFTFKKEMAKDFLCLRWPAQKTVKERKAFQLALDLGFTAPRIIAWGQNTKFGLPHKAAFIMEEIKGLPLDQYLTRETDREKCLHTIRMAEDLQDKMWRLCLDWPDNKPEHFIVQPNGTLALIDLERMTRRRSPINGNTIKLRQDHFHSLLPNI